MSVWVIGTTRNEVDLVRVNVRYHLAQGVDRFLLLDNDSTDGTTDLLRDLTKEAPLEWEPAPGRFQQNLSLTRLAHQAFARGAEWVIPIDADEFWRPTEGTLGQVLKSAPRGSIRVQLVNFIQRRQQLQTTPDALLGMTQRSAHAIGPMERGEDLVESQEIAYVEHLYHHKWISPASSALEIGWGNHVLHGGLVEVQPAVPIVCLHAPLRSFAVLEAKVDARRPSAEVNEYFGKVWHLRRWRRLAWENRLEEEWRANSYDDEGALDVYGVRRPVVSDDTLRAAVQPWMD
jgi:hypothetical protein